MHTHTVLCASPWREKQRSLRRCIIVLYRNAVNAVLAVGSQREERKARMIYWRIFRLAFMSDLHFGPVPTINRLDRKVISCKQILQSVSSDTTIVNINFTKALEIAYVTYKKWHTNCGYKNIFFYNCFRFWNKLPIRILRTGRWYFVYINLKKNTLHAFLVHAHHRTRLRALYGKNET